MLSAGANQVAMTLILSGQGFCACFLFFPPSEPSPDRHLSAEMQLRVGVKYQEYKDLHS